MGLGSLLVWVILGAIAGGVASFLMRSRTGLIVNIVVGVVGAFLGGWILNQLGLEFGQVGGLSCASIGTAVIGAVVLLTIVRLLGK
ncbi:MAG: hypothetical protein QG637_748 [Chloroflexota bacterium]|nr:hypothetical protein [Chloroflexota bacterium]